MSRQIDESFSDWADGEREGVVGDVVNADERDASEMAALLVVHGLLTETAAYDEDAAVSRMKALMLRIESEAQTKTVPNTPRVGLMGHRRVALLTSSFVVAAVLMAMVFVVAPQQSVSAAMASLERVIEAAAKPIDRTYTVQVIEQYSPDKRPRNLPNPVHQRPAKEGIDGASIVVRGANQYVMTVVLDSGIKRLIGCDGEVSWAFREDGPVHVSPDLDRFRGGMPGSQQDLPFLNIHDHLSQLTVGYDVVLSDQVATADDGSELSQLICTRKSNAVRGPKRVELSFDRRDGTVRTMVLDGLPRGRGGPKSVRLELTGQDELSPEFYSHQSHHEPGKRIRVEGEL